MTDAELLQDYADQKTEASFHAFVVRHLPLVYSSAFRQLRHAALAENAARVTFLMLAQRAASLSSETIVSEWLFCTTRHVASKVARVQERPGEREEELVGSQEREGDIWDQVALFIDDALDQLGEKDRGAVLLHYFENKRLREVGPSLGIDEEAAESCAERGIHKLQKILAKRAIPIPLAALPGLLMTHGALAHPSYLTEDIVATALNKKVISTAVYALLKASTAGNVWRNVKRAIAWIAVATLFLLALVQFRPKRMAAALADTRPIAPKAAQSAANPPQPTASTPPTTMLQPLASPAVPIPEMLPPGPPPVAVVQQARPIIATNQVAAGVTQPTLSGNPPGANTYQNPVVIPAFNLRASEAPSSGPQQAVNTSAPVMVIVPPVPSKFISNNYTARWSQPKQQSSPPALKAPKKK